MSGLIISNDDMKKLSEEHGDEIRKRYNPLVVNITMEDYRSLKNIEPDVMYIITDKWENNTGNNTCNNTKVRPKYHNCPNCGAVVTKNECSYCGTIGLFEEY